MTCFIHTYFFLICLIHTCDSRMYLCVCVDVCLCDMAHSYVWLCDMAHSYV